MPDWKGQKKSRSVNDIPLVKKPDQLLQSLDEDDFESLLSEVSRPLYNRRSSGFLHGVREDSDNFVKETSAIVKVCEKSLWDEDAAKEMLKKENQGLSDRQAISRSPSPTDYRVKPQPKQYCNIPYQFDESVKFDYIDSGKDVEMMDLSLIPPPPPVNPNPLVYKKGNQEKTVYEFVENDVELGLQQQQSGSGTSRNFTRASGDLMDFLHATPNNNLRWPVDPNEDGLRQDGKVLNRHHSFLPPQNEGNFSNFSYDLIGTDELPHLTVSPMPLPNTVQRVRIDSGATNNAKAEEKAIEPKREGKKKNKKKDKQGSTVLAENIPGFMGAKPLDDLINYIEGDEKKPKKDKSGGAVNSEEGKKERRRKSKEQKDTSSVTIGNQQGKSAAAAVVAVEKTTKEAEKTTKEDEKATKETVKATREAPQAKGKDCVKSGWKSSPKGGKARKSAGGVGWQKEEVEEEFHSADEGVSLDNETFAAVTDGCTNKKTSEVMLDGANYRADDEDVSVIERQIAEEEKFITVSSGKAKKKSTGQHSTPRTGSAGKSVGGRLVVEPCGGSSPMRRSSLEERGSTGRRHAPLKSLADFMEDKKTDNRKSSKHATPKQKTPSAPRSERILSTADSESAYHDAQSDEMMTTMRSNGTCTPERSFSYADAAKKSSDQSRENSPADTISQPCSVSQPATPSPTPAEQQAPPTREEVEKEEPVAVVPPTTETKEVEKAEEFSSLAEIPCNEEEASSAGGISFFYDENADSTVENGQPASPTPPAGEAFVLNLGDGKTFRFAKGMAVSGEKPVDSKHEWMVEMMENRWNEFMNRGPSPVCYTVNAKEV